MNFAAGRCRRNVRRGNRLIAKRFQARIETSYFENNMAEKSNNHTRRDQIIAERRTKLAELRKHGNAFPTRFCPQGPGCRAACGHGAQVE